MRMVEADLQDRVKMPNLWTLVKDPEEFWGDLSTHGRGLLKELLEGTLELWRDEWVQAEWHKPAGQRASYRNGYYRRKHWATALGPLEGLRVPRCRDSGLTDYMFKRLENHAEALGQSVVGMLLAGVSTRRVGDLLERIIGQSISAGQVSRLATRLDAELRAFQSQPIADDVVYLLLDGIHLKARGAPRLVPTGLRRTRRRVVLVAYGVRRSGVRQILGFQLATGETEAAWESFLRQLYQRGLQGRELRLITTDGGGGMISAVEAVFPSVPRQRCWFHKLANVLGKVRKKDRPAVLSGLREIYQAPNRTAAEKAFIAWARRWKDRYPKAVCCVEKDLEELLAFFRVPQAHRRMVRTTNPIERCFREVRRRTRLIGTFANDDSLGRIVYGLVAYWNHKYGSRVCKAFKKARLVA